MIRATAANGVRSTAGPALDSYGAEVVFGAVAATQTLAAALALKLASRQSQGGSLREAEPTAS